MRMLCRLSQYLADLLRKRLSLKVIALSYPLGLLFGLLVAFLLGPQRLRDQLDRVYFLQSDNVVNEVFAYHGNIVWTLLFVAVFTAQYYSRYCTETGLPQDARTTTNGDSRKQLSMKYAYRFIKKNIHLYIIFMFIDSVFVWTGGSCSIDDTITKAEKCRSLGGKWEGGFDISGHYCFLITLSMILWVELYKLLQYMDVNELKMVTSGILVSLIFVTIISVLIIWYCMLLVTAIYYHTVVEKLIGCFMGYLSPAMIYANLIS